MAAQRMVVVAAGEFERLRHRARGSLGGVLSALPLVGANLDLERDRDTGRDAPL
jgi:hypothetical protein